MYSNGNHSGLFVASALRTGARRRASHLGDIDENAHWQNKFGKFLLPSIAMLLQSYYAVEVRHT